MGKDRDWERFGVSDPNNLPVQEVELGRLIAEAEQAEAFLPENQREVLRSVHDGMATHLAACIQSGDRRPIADIRAEAHTKALAQNPDYETALEEYNKIYAVLSGNQNGQIH